LYKRPEIAKLLLVAYSSSNLLLLPLIAWCRQIFHDKLVLGDFLFLAVFFSPIFPRFARNSQK
jgi:hypothetical protein